LNPERIEIKASVLEADLVMYGVSQEYMFLKLGVHRAVPHDWERSKDDVVQLVYPTLVEGLATERGNEPEPELRHHKRDILVKHVNHRERVATIRFPAVEEHQRLEEAELTDCIVSRASGLFALQALYAYANMCGCNHAHVIRTVAYCQSPNLGIGSDHLYDLGLLQRRYSAGQHH
jgi:hypothetical protein